MIPLRSPEEIRSPTAIALGSFDGLHAGHQRVIAHAVRATAEATATVVSFWPHPREVLFGEVRLRLHMPWEKLTLLEPLGIRQLVLLPFNRHLAQLGPGAFVSRVLVKQLMAKAVAVGEDFRFGAGRVGDAALLQTLGEQHGLRVDVVPLLDDAGVRISSSRIRSALGRGDLQEAARLMPHPYRLRGHVVHGRGMGKRLGWPTANLRVDGRKFLPLEGVYACRVRVAGEAFCPGVMNLGPQPSVDPSAPSAVEVHLLDRVITLYGQELDVEPVRFLRRQQVFPGLDELAEQIGRDARQARAVLAAELTSGVGMGQTPGDQS